MKSERRSSPNLQVTERPSDFGPRRSTVLATGCSCCCCCCCLWSAGAAVGVATGFVLGRRKGKPAYRDMPRCIRRGFWRWGGLAALVVLLVPQVFTLAHGADGFVAYVVLAAVLLPLLLVPFSIGGLIGAYRARRFLARMGKGGAPEARDRRVAGDEQGQAASPTDYQQIEECGPTVSPDEVSMRPVWRVVGFMWLGAVIGTVLGILMFMPIAASW